MRRVVPLFQRLPVDGPAPNHRRASTRATGAHGGDSTAHGSALDARPTAHGAATGGTSLPSAFAVPRDVAARRALDVARRLDAAAVERARPAYGRAAVRLYVVAAAIVDGADAGAVAAQIVAAWITASG